MSTITPSAVHEVAELIESGQVVTFVQLTFLSPVRLIAIPKCHIIDGRGFSHHVTSASPHLVYAPFGEVIQLRSISTTPGLALVVWAAGDNSIIDAVSGDLIAAGSYTVITPPPIPPVPPIPPPPPLPPVPPVPVPPVPPPPP